MTIYVGMTQDLQAAKEYLLQKHNGMYPDVEMGPFKYEADAINYIKFMQNKFPDSINLDLQFLSTDYSTSDRWYVFSFEHSSNMVQ